MPRIPRVAPGGQVYHVFNRAHGRLRLFRSPSDYQMFYDVMQRAMARHPTRLLGWCVMGSQWHFIIWPKKDDELSRFFGYIGVTHAARWQAAHGKGGRVYQSRFKNFMIQRDEPHLASVLRYVESLPLRAGLVNRAEDWPWSSLHIRVHGPKAMRELLSDGPIQRPSSAAWVRQVNLPQSPAEQAAVEHSIRRSSPLGDERWIHRTAHRHGLLTTLRPRGRQPGWRKAK